MSIGLVGSRTISYGLMKLGLLVADIQELGLLDVQARNGIQPTLLNMSNAKRDECSGAIFQEHMGRDLVFFGERLGLNQ